MPDGENITIAELLKMRSGLFNYTADPALSAASDADPKKVWTPQEVLDIAFRHPAQFAPDTSYEYNNTNYALLGLIAEKAGGHPLAQQLQDRLFGPIGLKQTSLPAASDTSIPAPYAHGYLYGESHYALADEDPSYPADMQAAARAENARDERLHQPQLLLRHRCRGRDLDGRRPGHVDASTRLGQGFQRRLPPAVG